MKALKRTTAEIVAATAVSTGLLALARTLRRRRGGHRVFIVEYHDLTDGGGEPEMVGHASRLRSHIRELKRHFQVAPLGRQPGLWKAPGRRRGDLGAASTRRAHAEFSWRENARRMVAAYEAAIVRHDEAKPCTAR